MKFVKASILPHGIPDSDTFRRVFERLNPKGLAECQYDWLGVHWEKDTVVAIDGKSICGSKSESHKAYHVVSAFATDTRFFITSLTDIDRFAYAVRKHWSIENQLHWALDVIFEEDSSRARKDMSPLNLNVLRKTALALFKHAGFGPRVSLKRKRFSAALDPDSFLHILFAKS